jgi:hypothetical protein
MKKQVRMLTGLFIAIVVLVIPGIVAQPILRPVCTEEQVGSSVLLAVIPSIPTFWAINLAVIGVRSVAASMLNNANPARICRPIVAVSSPESSSALHACSGLGFPTLLHWVRPLARFDLDLPPSEPCGVKRSPPR